MMVHFEQKHCETINISTKDQPVEMIIKVDIIGEELKRKLNFFEMNKTIFAWSYIDLKGVPPDICQHWIILEDGAILIRQRQHRLNRKYSLLVKEKLDKLLKVGFIYRIPHSEWVSPIVMVPKKNGKIQKCQDFQKLNAVTRKDYFPLPFTNSMVNVGVRHECYSFLDGFSRYNQISIVVEDRLKTNFTTYWGTYAY